MRRKGEKLRRCMGNIRLGQGGFGELKKKKKGVKNEVRRGVGDGPVQRKVCVSPPNTGEK